MGWGELARGVPAGGVFRGSSEGTTALYAPDPHLPPLSTIPAGQHRALAYLKCKSGGKQVTLEGAAVVVNGVRGVVVAPPFLSRGFPEAAGSAASGGDTAAQQQEAADVQQKAAEEEKRRAEKLRQMQERLAAFQAQQQQQQ